MEGQSDADPGSSTAATLLLNRLLPSGDPASIPRIVEELGLWSRPPSPAPRPRLILNMVSSADGRATLEGRSGPLSDSADRQLFHGLRAAVDAVLVGAGTIRAERYGRLIPSERTRTLRRERGIEEEPLACVVSTSLVLGGDIPLLHEPTARVAILTSAGASLPATRARVDYVRTDPGRPLDLAIALAQVHERFAVSSVLCEGGPHLAAQLLDAGLVDELFLSLSPTLAGDAQVGDRGLRILAGIELNPPIDLQLLGVLQSESSLFMRYGVSACARVSRATTSSSSLAS